MTSETKDDAAGVLADVRGRILRAANGAGRRVDDVALIAVSKTKPADEIVPLIQAGQQRFGENRVQRSEEHTSELQSLMRISYAVFCLKKKTTERIQPTA